MTLNTTFFGEVSTFKPYEASKSVFTELINGFMASVVYPLNLTKGLRVDIENQDGTYTVKKFFEVAEAVESLTSKPDELTLFSLHRDDSAKVVLSIAKYHASPDSATTITYGVSNKLLSQKQRENVIHYLVNTTEWLMDVLNGANGYIAHDILLYGEPTFLEQAMKITGSVPALSEDFNRYFRGYFWGNYLGPDLVKCLGSLKDVLKLAPVYYAKEIAHNGVYLQLSEKIDDVTPEAFRQLREFLLPILPPKMRQLDLYLPYHLNDNPYAWF